MRRSSARRPSAPFRVVTQLALAAPFVALPALPTAPAATEAAPEGADVRLGTGVRIRYLERGNRAGRTVILIHGLCDSRFSYSRVIPGLAQAHRVFALDLRGHGESERPDTGYTPRALAADVVAFMDALGIERATLVGHSMGSFAAQQAAVAAPERVEGLVLIGSATSGRNATTLGLQQALASLPDTVPEQFAREFQMGTVYRPVPDDFMARAIAECRKPPARVWRAALDGMIEGERFRGLGGKPMPTLLIWGDRDGVFPRSEQEALISSLTIASLRVYRETGHAPHWERPAEVVRDITRFLQ